MKISSLFSLTFLSGAFYTLFLCAGGTAFSVAAIAGLAVSWWVGLATTIASFLIIIVGLVCDILAKDNVDKEGSFPMAALFFLVIFSPVILLLLWLSLYYPIGVGDYRALVLYGIAYLISFIQKNAVSAARKAFDAKD